MTNIKISGIMYLEEGIADFFYPLANKQIRKEVKIVDDYIAYRQTLTESCADVYTDNIQNSYDYADEYQGCQSWYEYQKEWN